jgi:hypothetical protein
LHGAEEKIMGPHAELVIERKLTGVRDSSVVALFCPVLLDAQKGIEHARA